MYPHKVTTVALLLTLAFQQLVPGRGATDVAAVDRRDQKRQRRHGSPAGRAPHTPKSSVSVDIHATSPDTGCAPCGDTASTDAPHDSGDSNTIK